MLATSIQRSKEYWTMVGEKRGREYGEKLGEKRGEKRGERRGAKLGILQKAIEDVLYILTVRFDSVPEDLESQIKQCSDLDKLNTALRDAVTVKELDEFKF